ncbi:hypothetical protein Tco_1093096 [Tanacetum coccineum]|uniref:Uncharacterized protein n=1 Tax=Tanacetum coccineum TaxID=301880 RepID=A0ABQ5IBQ0_9ASTR
MDYQCTQPSEIEICRQAEEIERQREIKERNRVHEETMQMLREMIKIQEEKRIAKEKEAAELEAKHKIQECLNIKEKSIPQASTRSRKFRIDPTLRNFTISTKRIPFLQTGKPSNALKTGISILTHKKSSVEDLVPTPSESADLSDGESECDVLVGDESSSTFTTFSNPLFDSNDDFTSSDDESLSDEDVPKENFKIYSNPLFDEEIISTKIDPICFSMPNSRVNLASSPIQIPPGVVDTDLEPEEEIRLAENLSYEIHAPWTAEERKVLNC